MLHLNIDECTLPAENRKSREHLYFFMQHSAENDKQLVVMTMWWKVNWCVLRGFTALLLSR